MSERRTGYCVDVLQTYDKPATLNAEAEAVRLKLRDLKRQLIGVLVTVDYLLGDEPSVKTRAERRRE